MALPKLPKGTLRNLVYLIRLQWSLNPKTVLLNLLFGLFRDFESLMAIVFPKLILDALLQEGAVSAPLVLIGAFALLSFFCNHTLSYLKGYQVGKNMKNDYLLVLKMVQKSIRLDFGEMEGAESQNQFMHGLDNIFQMTTKSIIIFNSFITSVIKLFCLIAIVATLDLSMILILLALVAVNLLLNNRAMKRNHEYQITVNKTRRHSDYAAGRMADIPTGKELRLYQARSLLLDKYDRAVGETLTIQDDQSRYNRRIGWLRSLLNNLQTAVIYLFLLLKYSLGHITIGSFTLYIGAANQFYETISDILDIFNELAETNILCDEFRSFMEKPETMRETRREDRRLLLSGGRPPTLEFRHVSFRYPGQQQNTLEDICLAIAPEEKFSIIGENGAGKTTFVKLLMRLYDPTDGVILVDGVDIREYDYDEYLRLFSPVFQDFRLFPNTIRENIGFGEPDNEERVTAALKKAHIYDRVQALPLGMDTWLHKDFEGGVELSGGEMQKLAIARAFYKDAPVVILDEPTAALDPLAEHEIYRQFNDLSDRKTALYISHRMSSSRFCDHVAVFDQGRLAEYGTHSSLMAADGIYADLYHKQAQYYVDA
ncbi:MAG: ABC transporter ATP-binding protein [Clostridiales bacterium]|nr:ABC transporter ATP-binding protein [Clostridiales bacterium]